MKKLWLMLVCALIYGITNTIVKHYTGIDPTGWRFLVYDAPALFTGMLSGYFLWH